MSLQLMKVGAFALACASAASAAKIYTIDETYEGEGFFNKFNFFTGLDPTRGYVQYQSQADAASTKFGSKLVNTINGQNFMGVDHTNTYDPFGAGRPSVRIETKKTYNHGLFILDLAHMPSSTCGNWPAFWTYSDVNYPAQGEIDILENIHENTQSLNVLHTSAGFSVAGNKKGLQQSGDQTTYNCDDNAQSSDYGSQFTGQGCASTNINPGSYGSALNAVGGGVYAMEWTSDVIRVWSFPKVVIPLDIIAGKPDPSKWGLPTFTTAQGKGDIDSHFKDHKVVLDTTFCGNWAGQDFFWKQTSCYDPILYPTCSEYVGKNPSKYADTYWLINSLKVFQLNEAPVTTSSSSTSSSTSSKPTTSSTVSTTSSSSASSSASLTSSSSSLSSSATTAASTSSTSTSSSASSTASSSTSSSVSATSATSSVSSSTSADPTSSTSTSSSVSSSTSADPTSSTSVSSSVSSSTDSSSTTGSTSSTSSSASSTTSDSSTSETSTSTSVSSSATSDSTTSTSETSSSTSSTVATPDPTLTSTTTNSGLTFSTTSSSSRYYGNSSTIATTTPSSTIETLTLEPTTTPMTTSTVFTTFLSTITKCPETVTNCPLGSVTTVIVPLYTTICPVSAISTPTTTPAGGNGGALTTSTVYTTSTGTVTKCPATVTNCPYGSLTTVTIPLYTTICPVAGKPTPVASIPGTVSVKTAPTTTLNPGTSIPPPVASLPCNGPACPPVTIIQTKTTIYTYPGPAPSAASSPVIKLSTAVVYPTKAGNGTGVAAPTTGGIVASTGVVGKPSGTAPGAPGSSAPGSPFVPVSGAGGLKVSGMVLLGLMAAVML